MNYENLNSEQKDIHDGVLLNVLEKQRQIRIIGSAGTGKTYLCGAIVRSILEKTNLTVCVTAPTHKALKVLKSKIEPAVKMANIPHKPVTSIEMLFGNSPKKDRVIFKTVHSALFLKKKVIAGGKSIFVKDKFTSKNKKPFEGCRVVILDESSMISSDIKEYIDECDDITIIYLGEHCPV